MNNLNTQQIVLLCLLVSFVTSITTGISVVSLMDQSPEPVTQTINRIVEKTVERVVDPEPVKNTITKTPDRIIETVIVNQEDLSVEAVSKNAKSLVRIYTDNKGVAGEYVTLGVAVSDSMIVADKNLLLKRGNYIGKTKSGDFPLEINYYETADNFALLKIKENKTGFTKAEFADSNSLQLAQSVISLSGVSSDSVSTGVISKLDSFSKTEGGNTWNEITRIYTGVDPENVLVGSILITLQGKIIGIKTFDQTLARTTFTPSNTLKSFLSDRGI